MLLSVEEQSRVRFNEARFIYVTAIMTSDALITTIAQSPTFKPRSSIASFVIDDVMTCSCVISTRTTDVVIPYLDFNNFPSNLIART
jgi:hypothetical protein